MASTKERAWLEDYLTRFNATESARQVGYKWPNKLGPRLKQKFAKEIEQRIDERTLSADEALSMLSDIATGDMGDVIKLDHGLILVDWEGLEEKGLTHLVKKYKHTKQGIEVELYPRDAALVNILKHISTATGKEDDPIHITTEKRVDRITELFDRARTNRARATNS